MTPAELLRGILDGDRHAGGIRCLRLFTVEQRLFSALVDEVTGLCGSERASDVTRPGHITNWTKPFGEVRQFSILNRTGRFDDFSADHDLSCLGKRFYQSERYPTLGQLISCFPHAVNFRVSVLGSKAGLSPHEEHALIQTKLGTVGARVRFHLPVVTNPGAQMLLDGQVHHLERATLWFVNHGCVHDAANHGDEDRIHLNWDMLLTADTYELMFGDGPAPSPFVRIPEDRRTPIPVGTRRVGVYQRIPPQLPREKAQTLSFCEVQ
jgi:aspartyl/asparaginyl beta-hydroxylase